MMDLPILTNADLDPSAHGRLRVCPCGAEVVIDGNGRPSERATGGALVVHGCSLDPDGGRGSDPRVRPSVVNRVSVVGEEWPRPLAQHAFQGLAGEIVRAIEPHTEADLAALLVQLLAAFGNAVGHGPYFRTEGDRQTANLFVVVAGATAKARKGTSWGRINALMEAADPTWRVASGLSSGEGLPARLDRKDHGESTPNQRLMIQESEFARTLRAMGREGNTLSAILRQAFDTGDLSVLTRKNPIDVRNAHVSVVAHITIEELRTRLADSDAANGFGNRFLYVAARRSKLLPFGGAEPRGWADLTQRLHLVIEEGNAREELRFDSDAEAMWIDVYPELSQGERGLVGSLTARSEALVIRLALMFALLDRAGCIRSEHLTAALAVWDYCHDSARFIFGDRLGDPVAERILRELRLSADGLARSAIRDLFSRNLDASSVEAALELLSELGLVSMTRVATRGRPREVWIATTETTYTTEGAAR